MPTATEACLRQKPRRVSGEFWSVFWGCGVVVVVVVVGGQSQAENMRSASPEWVGFQHSLLLDVVVEQLFFFLFFFCSLLGASDTLCLPVAGAHISPLEKWS